MHRTPSRTKKNQPPPGTRGQAISETIWSPANCDHCHPVRQTNPWPTELVHVIGIQTPRPRASRHRLAQGYPPRLISTDSTRGPTPNPFHRTRRAPVSLPGLCSCVQMGSWRGMVWREETTNSNRMVLYMASNNQRPVLLGLEQNWVTHNLGPGTHRHTPPVACPRTRG
jgi:hypothetical protein